MAAGRLRRTFAYPDSEDDEDGAERGLDGQDHAIILHNLGARDVASTKFYTSLLLMLPLAPIPLCTAKLLFGSQSPWTVVSISSTAVSLLCSAYTLWFLPLAPRRSEDDEYATTQTKTYSKKQAGTARTTFGMWWTTTTNAPLADDRPRVPFISRGTAHVLERNAVPSNVALCVLLGAVEIWRGRSWNESVSVGGGLLPLVVLLVVLLGRMELKALDMGELVRLNGQLSKDI